MRSRMVIGALRHPKILIPAGPESSWQLNGAAEAAAPFKTPDPAVFPQAVKPCPFKTWLPEMCAFCGTPAKCRVRIGVWTRRAVSELQRFPVRGRDARACITSHDLRNLSPTRM